jgi:hypothetical protein
MACYRKAFRCGAKHDLRHFRDGGYSRVLCNRDFRNLLELDELRFIVRMIAQHSRQQYQLWFSSSPHIRRNFELRVPNPGSACLR